MMSISDHTYILADSSKFEAAAPIRVCDLSEVDAVVTDHGIDRQIYQLYRRQPACYTERCSGIIKEILFTALAEQQDPETANHPGGSLATAEQTMKYIEAHFREPINEQSIAAALNFHPYYLTRLTVRYFGLTPYQYLLQCRTEEALSMLLNTDKPVGEIATSCGFVSPSHFSTVIRRKTGLTPGMIRKSAALPKDWATE